MGGKSSQHKGRAGELELAELLRQYGYEIKPGSPLNYGKEPDLSGLPGVHIEVKRVERLNIGQAMQQALRDARTVSRWRTGCISQKEPAAVACDHAA